MLVDITPITVTLPDGTTVICQQANTSAAISSSLAMTVIPTDASGNEYPDAAIGLVGASDQADIATFLAAVTAATSTLLTGRGI